MESLKSAGPLAPAGGKSLPIPENEEPQSPVVDSVAPSSIAKAGRKRPDKARLEAQRKMEDNILKGLMGGTAGVMAYEYSGLGTLLHEEAHKVMVEKLYHDAAATVQIDALDNIRSFMDKPSLENLGHILSGFDINKDGAAGVTQYTYGDGPTALGEKMSPNARTALISAAGSVSTLIPDLIGFAAGMKLRKTHPILGYSLMAMTGVHHFANAMYPLGAVLPGPKSPGHDWAKFASATGIHPAITGALFAVTLPAVGAGIYWLEKRNEEKLRDHEALTRLISRGAIPRERLDVLFETYPQSEELKALEDEMQKGICQASSLKDPHDASLKALSKKLRKEYYHFGDYLINKNRAAVDEEKKAVPKPQAPGLGSLVRESIAQTREDFKKDRPGTILNGASLVSGLTLYGANVVNTVHAVSPDTLPAIAGTTAGKVLGTLVPLMGVVFTAGSAYRAARTMKDPEASRIDKVAACSSTFFTGLAAAGSAVPALGLPVTLAGLAGLGVTALGRKIAEKLSE
jgi:hypothetical protein